MKLSTQSLLMLAHGNAGSIASLISTLLLYPFENIKTRMQVVDKENMSKDNVEGVRQVIQKILSQEGFAGFYKGITPLLIGNYISYGIYFFWYEFFKVKFQTNCENPFATLKPSFLAAIVTTIGTNPFWVIQSFKILSLNIQDGLNFYKTTAKMIEKEGLMSLFKGLQTSLILVINPIIQFTLYELFKQRFKGLKYQSFIHFFGGAISKAIATFVTYPYQVLRTYAHLDHNQTDYIELLKTIMTKMGFQGLYRGSINYLINQTGFTPKLTQTVLNSAFLLMFQEAIVKIITIYSNIIIRYFLRRKQGTVYTLPK